MTWEDIYVMKDCLATRCVSSKSLTTRTEQSSQPSYFTDKTAPATILSEKDMYKVLYKGRSIRDWETFFTGRRITENSRHFEDWKAVVQFCPSLKACYQNRSFEAERTVERINKKFKEKRKAELLQKSVTTINELREKYKLPALISPEKPLPPLKERLDFWNYPDWERSGNLRDGAQPFWMFDNVEPKPDLEPEPPKPTHKRIVKVVAGVEVIIMEPL